MLIDLPAGNHHLVLSFEVRDRPQRIARWVSILAWLLFISWIVRIKIGRGKHETSEISEKREKP
jgi:hypothetical protein